MNRIILIGNGFDIAHGLKTNYADFIHWYWKEWGNRLLSSSNRVESDEFCSFSLRDYSGYTRWYLIRDHYFQKNAMSSTEFIQYVKKDKNLCEFKYKSPFFEQINKNIETKGWVDIENEYYELLINTKSFSNHYLSLNNQLNILKDKLVRFLTFEEEKERKLIIEIKERIYRPVERTEMAVGSNPSLMKYPCRNIMLLNFNYTNTPEMYLADNSTVNYIHGKLDNPESVIFGYGDELDENYKRLKEQHDIECMRHVKSIRYLEHDSYRRMLEFIESDPFQICIMGHSCGNSDRTLLNTLFEHRNCVSIKPYYYQKPDGTDNYSELTININRNFTAPKLMRDLVVNKEYCEQLTHDE